MVRNAAINDEIIQVVMAIDVTVAMLKERRFATAADGFKPPFLVSAIVRA